MQSNTNVTLIAAAPKMFEALTNLIDRLDLDAIIMYASDELKKELENSYIVLKKAMGEES